MPQKVITNNYRLVLLCPGNFLVIKDIETVSILKIFEKFDPSQIKSIEKESNISKNFYTEFAIKDNKVHIAPMSIVESNLIKEYWPETNIELIHYIK